MNKHIKVHTYEPDNNNISQECNFPKNKSSIIEKKIDNKFKIITKNLKNVSLNILKNTKNYPNILNLNNNLVNEIPLIKFRPKRLIRINDQGNSKIAFTEVGGNPFGIYKTNKSSDKKIILQNRTGRNLLSNLTTGLNINNNFSDNEFKSYYILKFAKNSEELNKLKNCCDLMSDNLNKRFFIDNFEKLSKLIETQNKLYFKNIDLNQNSNLNENYLNNILSKQSTYNSNINAPPINFNETTRNRTRNKSVQDFPCQNIFSNTADNMHYSTNITKYNNNLINSTYITTVSSFNSSNIHKNMKDLISNWSEIISILTKFLSNILKDLSIYKTEHFNLKRKSIIDETQLNKVSKELEDLKKYINKFDINNKIYSQMHKENKIKELKKGFNLKENEYKVTIYKLEEEIKSLTNLLDKNKIYYEKYIDLTKEVDKNKKEKELLKIKYNKELQENNVQVLVEKDLKDELYLKIEKLNEEINEINKEKNEEKKEVVELQSIIKKLRLEIIEKKENIMMLNEELEIYINKYFEEKTKHLNILKDLKLLEQKVYQNKDINVIKDSENKNENNAQNQ